MTKRWTAWLVGAVAVLAAAGAMAFPPKPPYDPRPLMTELEKKVTSDKYTFVVTGDIQGGSGLPSVAARVAAIGPQFVVFTGDMVQLGSGGTYDQFERVWGPFMRKTPAWPCMGNHDSHGKGNGGGEGGFRQFWGMEPRYSFDFRNARFIIMKGLWGTAFEKPDMDWLEQTLAEGQKAGKLMFVVQHCPCYTVGGRKPKDIPGKPTPFTKLLTRYGVVADFSGHEHMYYRTKREGVTFITAGLGGSGVYGLGRTNEAIEGDAYFGALPDGTAKLHTDKGDKVMKKTFMVNVLSVDGGKVTGKMVAVDGAVIDEYVLREGK